MGGMSCPNCGYLLVPYRTDRQQTTKRVAVLRWAICEGCRHIGLVGWSFEDTPEARVRPDSDAQRDSMEVERGQQATKADAKSETPKYYNPATERSRRR